MAVLKDSIILRFFSIHNSLILDILNLNEKLTNNYTEINVSKSLLITSNFFFDHEFH